MNSLAVRDSLQLYLDDVSKHPVLNREEEYDLAVKYYEDKDLEAAKKLVVSNLRFVVKVANSYSSYGFPLADMIQEGSVGLMRAIQKFDPYKGTRLITYAVWWIKVYIQNFISKSWSMVSSGVSRSKKPFFRKLSPAKQAQDVDRDGIEERGFDADSGDVVQYEIEGDKAGLIKYRDLSLDSTESLSEGSAFVDFVYDERPLQEEIVEANEIDELTKKGLSTGFDSLTSRERYIIESRYKMESPVKLRELGDELGISKERVRQIESKALGKLRVSIDNQMN